MTIIYSLRFEHLMSIYPLFSHLESAMTEKGALKVDECFRVEGYTNIFALGDCTNIDEPKIGALAIQHGEIMASTILSLDKGKEPTSYKPGMQTTVYITKHFLQKHCKILVEDQERC